MNTVFKTGDMVTVTHKVKEEKGWEYAWTGATDLIGQTFEVAGITVCGVLLKGTDYAFPPSSLKLVSKKTYEIGDKFQVTYSWSEYTEQETSDAQIVATGHNECIAVDPAGRRLTDWPMKVQDFNAITEDEVYDLLGCDSCTSYAYVASENNREEEELEPQGIAPGKELLVAAFNQILLHPETWNQSKYHCGTSHCFGGWCEVLAGRYTTDKIGGAVRKSIYTLLEECGMSEDEVDDIVCSENSIDDIYLQLMNFLGKPVARPIVL